MEQSISLLQRVLSVIRQQGLYTQESEINYLNQKKNVWQVLELLTEEGYMTDKQLDERIVVSYVENKWTQQAKEQEFSSTLYQNCFSELGVKKVIKQSYEQELEINQSINQQNTSKSRNSSFYSYEVQQISNNNQEYFKDQQQKNKQMELTMVSNSQRNDDKNEGSIRE